MLEHDSVRVVPPFAPVSGFSFGFRDKFRVQGLGLRDTLHWGALPCFAPALDYQPLLRSITSFNP